MFNERSVNLRDQLIANCMDCKGNAFLWRHWSDGTESFVFRGQTFPVIRRSISVYDNDTGRSFVLRAEDSVKPSPVKADEDAEEKGFPEFIVMDLSGPEEKNLLRFCLYSEAAGLLLTSLDNCTLDMEIVLAASRTTPLALAASSRITSGNERVSGLVRGVEKDFIRYVIARGSGNYENED